MADEDDDIVEDIEKTEDKPSDDVEADEKPDKEMPAPEDEDKATEEEDKDAEAIAENEAEKKGPKEEASDMLAELPKDETKAAPDDTLEPSTPPSQLDRYQNFINQYKKLQENRQRSDLAAGLIAAGGKIGQSIAGKYSGQFNPDLTGVKLMEQQASRPISDMEQQLAAQGSVNQLQTSMAASDPTSPQSKLTRDYLKTRLGINLPDNVSAADAQMLLKTVGKPLQSKFQAKTGIYIDDSGKEHKILASYDPLTGKIYNQTTHEEIPNERFIPEGLNPYQMVKGEQGQQQQFNKSRGGAPTNIQGHDVSNITDPHQLYVTLKPEDRKELNDKLVPAFNKATEKTQQRLTHVPVIMQRLQEAQTNPAALPQLKAELARFDVGDQRLAAQEFNMFGQRGGYKGWEDWLNNHTTGTISNDFAENMAKAINGVAVDLRGELSNKAEEQANLMASRTKANPQSVAKLIYGKYQPQVDKVRVRNIDTGVVGTIPKANLQKALDSKKYEVVQ
jgi:hypothetical protein